MPYIRPTPRNEYESAVQDAGYPWFSTVNLVYQNDPTDYSQSPPIFNRLNRHQHQSANTHLIVRNQLSLRQIGVGRVRTIRTDNGPRGNKELAVPPNQEYEGWTDNRDGCTFVEAHTVLSPTTARRFEDRGDPVWVQRGRQTREQWCAQESRKPIGPVSRVDVRGLYY